MRTALSRSSKSRMGRWLRRRRTHFGRSWRQRFGFELLESRNLLATFVVDTVSDAGPGSLRSAIAEANANAGFDTIAFAIPGAGIQTIRPVSPLPTIVDAVHIDGTTQPGWSPGNLAIALDGELAGTANGLVLTSSGSTIAGLAINQFTGDGVLITGAQASDNRLVGNHIGVFAGGEGSLIDSPTAWYKAESRADSAGDKNLSCFCQFVPGRIGNAFTFSGSGSALETKFNNRLSYETGISVDAWFKTPGLATGQTQGVIFSDGGAGTSPYLDGISIFMDSLRRIHFRSYFEIISPPVSIDTYHHVAATWNGQAGGIATLYIDGQSVGSALATQTVAVSSLPVAIGGLNSGSVQLGTRPFRGEIDEVHVFKRVITPTEVGLIFGAGSRGTGAGNHQSGIHISAGAHNNLIDTGNVIGGNRGSGILIDGGSTTDNMVRGSVIGLDANGATRAGNTLNGIYILDAPLNTVGDNESQWNVIAGNDVEDLVISGSLAANNVVSSNIIGFASNGIDEIPNKGTDVDELVGVVVQAGAHHNLVGGVGAFPNNIIRNIDMRVDSTDENRIQGNRVGGIQVSSGLRTIIGTDGDGVTDAGEGNVIGSMFIEPPSPETATEFVLAGNTIGSLGVFGGASRIGTDGNGLSDDLERNYISDLSIQSGKHLVSGNYIGVDATGQSFAGGSLNLFASTDSEVSNNVVSSIVVSSSTNTRITGNIVGLDATGLTPLAIDSNTNRMEYGILVSSSTNTVIGGTSLEDRNVIGGFTRAGIQIDFGNVASETAPAVTVQGNLIGVTGRQGGRLARTTQQVRGDAGDSITVEGVVSSQPGLNGQALSFDGGFVKLNDSPSTKTTPLSLNLWAKATPAALSSGQHTLAASGSTDSTANGYWLGFENGKLQFRTLHDGSSTVDLLEAPTSIVPGTWYNIAATFGAERVKRLYINGELVASSTASGPLHYDLAASSTLGEVIENNTSANKRFSGLIDEAIFLSRTLTDFEIAEIFSAGGFATADPGIGNEIGISIFGRDNLIGGLVDGAANVIASSRAHDIFVSGNDPSFEISGHNTIQGNFIGTNQNASLLLSDNSGAVSVSSTNNLVGGGHPAAKNIIAGRVLLSSVTGPEGSTITPFDNSIQGNFINLRPDGINVFAMPGEYVAEYGLLAAEGNDNVLGSDANGSLDETEGNTIAAVRVGIQVEQSGARIAGNRINTNSAGNSLVSNAELGIKVTHTADGTIIGGSVPSQRNVIGGAQIGIQISGLGGENTGTSVAGNHIGTDITGTLPLPNNTGISVDGEVSGLTIGGMIPAARNLISGNQTNIALFAVTGTNSAVVGNYIGTDFTGNQTLGENGVGISISSRSWRIGVPESGNIIGGHSAAGISGQNTSSISVQGNRIGIGADGVTPIPNDIGIAVLGDMTIGGTTPGAGNVISGNATGIHFFNATGSVVGNLIGTTAGGLLPTDQLIGVRLDASDAEVSDNTISGNAEAGIYVRYESSPTITKNRIGTSPDGLRAVGGQAIGVHIEFDAYGVTIGGDDAADRNTISGNDVGVLINGDRTLVRNNWIGPNIQGQWTPGLPNGIGILVGADFFPPAQNSIIDNWIVSSVVDGVQVRAGNTVLSQNRIHDNSGYAINLNSPVGTISLQQARLDGFAIGQISGATPYTTFTVEFFAATLPEQAESFVGTRSIVTDENGQATFEVGGLGDLQPGKYLTATITGARTEGGVDYSTSQLSSGAIPQSAIIRGLPTRSPEGTPISLQAFAVDSTITGYAITGYVWEVRQGNNVYAVSNEAGIQFSPDDEGIYTVQLKLTLTNTVGDQQTVILGPHTINVFNVAPTAQFEIEPYQAQIGQAVSLRSSSTDPGRDDELQHTWEVRYGSPTGPVVYSTGPAAGVTTTTFTPTSGGNHYVKLTVDDLDGGPNGSRSLVRLLQVRGLPTSTSILMPNLGSEGQTIRARAPESELQRADELTFAWQVLKNGNVYPFNVPSAGVIEFTPDDDGDYSVSLTVSDGSNISVAQTQHVTVTNTSPIVSIDGFNSIAQVGQQLNLSANIFDPGSADTHQLSWTVERSGTVIASSNSSSPPWTFSFTPAQIGVYKITATATDDDYDSSTSVGRATGQKVIFVADSNQFLAIANPDEPPGGFIEGSSTPFKALLPALPPGVTVSSYQWSALDRLGREIQAVPGIGPTVPDYNFTPPAGGEFVAVLELLYSNGQTARAISQPINVLGRTPQINSIELVSHASNQQVYEGELVRVRTSALDASEQVGLSYLWELQRPGGNWEEVPGMDSRPSELQFMPLDDGVHRVRVTVSDSEGLSVTEELTRFSSVGVAVLNALPTIRLSAPDNTGTQVTFVAQATDPGVLDQSGLLYSWSVDGVVFSSPVSSNSLSVPMAGLNSLTVRVYDDTGYSELRSSVLLGTNNDDLAIITVGDATSATAAGSTQLIYLALDGDDTVVVSAGISMLVMVISGAGNDTLNACDATAPVTLDGGNGNDALCGGAHNDILIPGAGTNTASGGNGNNVFIGGGNDTLTGGTGDDYYFVHFSEVSIHDTAGGLNTIDLSGAVQGITLDFGSTSGLPQTVFPGSTLALHGTFQKLVGSPHSDNLATDKPGTTLVGGDGHDHLVASALGVTLDGGAGNNELVLNNASGIFIGGSGSTKILGTLAADSSSTIELQGSTGSIEIAGTAPTGSENLAEVRITGGSGSSTITAQRVRGKIYAYQGSVAGAINEFGTTRVDATRSITISQSADIDIFGSTRPGNTIVVTQSADVDIFGAGGDEATLDQVSRGAIYGSLFGTVTGPRTLSATITASDDIDIFGSVRPQTTLVTSINNSVDIDIFGSTRSQSQIVVRGGEDIDIFGIAEGSIVFQADEQALGPSRGSIHISEFGSVISRSLPITVTASADIDIFGSSSPTGTPLNATIHASSDIDIFGTTARQVSITVTSSQDIDIFGVVDGDIRLGPVDNTSTTDAVTRAVIEAAGFGSTSVGDQLNLTIRNSTEIDIFGGVSANSAPLNATILNSSDIDIFGSVRGGQIQTTQSQDIDIFGQGSQSIALDDVDRATIFTQVFGTTTPLNPLQVTIVNQSSDIDIFGSVNRNARIQVNQSVDIDIFGGTAETVLEGVVHLGDVVILNAVTDARVVAGVFGTTSVVSQLLQLTVNSSSDIDIFGSVRGTSRIEVNQSQDIDIFGAFGDELLLEDSQQVRVEGGLFGTVIPGAMGLTATISGTSQDIDIFGTITDDLVTIQGGFNHRVALRAGTDVLNIADAQAVIAIVDQGDDQVTVHSGRDMLLYLAAGNDRAAVQGGENIRVIGGEGADEILLTGGSIVDIDGGPGDDSAVLVSGSSTVIRLDSGQNKFHMFGGVGSLVIGGTDADQMTVYGRLGTTLSNGQVYAVLDGGAGDDILSVLPLYALDDPNRNSDEDPLSNLPTWMLLPLDISAPFATELTSSIAMIGGTGNDVLRLAGNQRLFGFGGDGDDSLTLLTGSTSILSGGDGADVLNLETSGVGNYLFGGNGDDIVQVFNGGNSGVFTESGNDTVQFSTAADAQAPLQSFARGGTGNDTFTISAGSQILVAGEVGQNTIHVTGGQDIVAAGGSGNDQLTVSGGQKVVLLGESGNDRLQFDGGENTILSGGDGNDQIVSNQPGVQLYGDDGDDQYDLKHAGESNQSGAVLIRELLFLDGENFEAEARGSDTIDLSAFSIGATLDLRLLAVSQAVIPGLLSVQLLGAVENIVGTLADDWLYGNNETNRLEGRGGNDHLLGFGGDDVLIGGAGQNTLAGDTGNDTYLFENIAGSHTIVEADGQGIDRLDFSALQFGLGDFSLASYLPQTVAEGSLTVSLVNALSPAGAGAIEELTGTNFDDRVFGNSLDNRFQLLQGNDTVNGLGGDDLYLFAGSSFGSLTILDESSFPGRRTLDLTNFSAPIELDLEVQTPQHLSQEFAMTLINPLSIHNVVGTSFDDRILGNANDNSLYGAGGRDWLAGREGNDQLFGGLTQVVLLDFASAFRAERGDYNYSPAQQQEILTLIAARYSAFNWRFTLSEAEALDWTRDAGRAFIRLNFSEGRGGGVSGDAGEIDFRNINRGLVSQVNINSLKASIPMILESSLGREPSLAEIDTAIVRLTAHIAAHELGHTSGLRHADALGPIGSGFYVNADLSHIYPEYTGPLAADETPFHLLASPASIGTTIADALGDTYFGAREAIKLAFNDQGWSLRENNTNFGSHSNLDSSAQDLGWLAPLYVPNLAPSTGREYSNSIFQVSAAAVVAQLASQGSGTNSVTERDVYRFHGRAGEWVNIEVLANGISPLRGQMFDGQVKLYSDSGQLLAWNDDEFEGTKDAVLQDVQLPADGEYYIEVSLSDAPAIDAPGDYYELFVSRFRALPVGSSLPAVPGDTFIGGIGNDQLVGSDADDLFLATQSGGIDTIFGQSRFDTLDILGLDYDFEPALLNSIERIANQNIAPSAVLVGVPTGPVQASTDWTVSLQNPSDPSLEDTSAGFHFAFALTLPDGSMVAGNLPTSWSAASDVSSQTFNISQAGVYTLIARIFDIRNGYRDYQAQVIIEASLNLPPTGILIDNTLIDENQPPGVLVGRLSATDPDAIDTHTFQLAGGSGDADNSLFEIVGDQLRTRHTFDYETRHSYSIRLQARDSVGNVFAKSLTLAVRNAPELIGEIVVGDGTVQRSLVKQLSMVFDTELVIDPEAFKVQRRDFDILGNLAPVDVPIQVSQLPEGDGRFRIVINFIYAGGSSTVRPGSLALQDGNYQLLINGAKLRAVGSNVAFDADGDHNAGGLSTFGDQSSDGFYSFFGDIRGLRVAGAFENNALRKTLGKVAGQADFDSRFDADGNQAIGAFDNNEMRKSLLLRVFNWR